jgi:thiosulfate reductase cytochrome b subunit
MAVIEQSPAVPAAAAPAAARGREVVYRHAAVVRVTHWINALCLALLLMSGLRIFNYHPALYWGNYGYRGLPSFISIGAVESSESDEITGITRIGPWSFVTTGVLGVSADSDGDPAAMAFPNWITLPGGPGLALARDWHFALAWLFAANGLV